MVVKGKWGSAACAVALTGVTVLSAGCSSGGGSSSDSVATTLSTNYGPAETTTVNRRRGARHGLGRLLRRV